MARLKISGDLAELARQRDLAVRVFKNRCVSHRPDLAALRAHLEHVEIYVDPEDGVDEDFGVAWPGLVRSLCELLRLVVEEDWNPYLGGDGQALGRLKGWLVLLAERHLIDELRNDMATELRRAT